MRWLSRIAMCVYSIPDTLFILEQNRCSYTRQTEDQYLIYADKVTDAFNDIGCRQACTQESEFNCRSYSFKAKVRVNVPSFSLDWSKRLFLSPRIATILPGVCCPVTLKIRPEETLINFLRGPSTPKRIAMHRRWEGTLDSMPCHR